MQSIHQMGAQSIISMYRKITRTGKPSQLFNQLYKTEGRNGTTWKVKSTPRLTITSSDVIEKGTKLWNMISEEIKIIEADTFFKTKCKQWTMKNIPIKPG